MIDNTISRDLMRNEGVTDRPQSELLAAIDGVSPCAAVALVCSPTAISAIFSNKVPDTRPPWMIFYPTRYIVGWDVEFGRGVLDGSHLVIANVGQHRHVARPSLCDWSLICINHNSKHLSSLSVICVHRCRALNPIAQVPSWRRIARFNSISDALISDEGAHVQTGAEPVPICAV